MFFIGVFGINNKEEEIKTIEDIQCKNCNDNQDGKLIKTYNVFHFFFIPIFKWKERYFLICKACKSIYEIPIDKGKDMERGGVSNITYWDLKPVDVSYRNGYKSRHKCSNCGKEVKTDFEYCPYCGTKIDLF